MNCAVSHCLPRVAAAIASFEFLRRLRIVAQGSDQALTATADDIELGLNQMRQAVAEDIANGRFELNASTAAVFGLSVGYVSWLLRGGLLLSSVLSSLPVWRFVDPLPVFARERDQQSEEGDDESLAAIVQGGGAETRPVASAPSDKDAERMLQRPHSPDPTR